MIVKRGLRCWRSLVFVGLVCWLAAPAPADDQDIEARLRRDITFLASDQCEGRGVTTRGINLAADYIARAFQQAGLKPAGPDHSYFQLFTMPGNTLAGPPRLVLRGPLGQKLEFTTGTHFRPLGISGSGTVYAPVVFVGYGVTGGKDLNYDDYAGIDVAGKVVVILRDTPRTGNRYASFGGRQRLRYAALVDKMLNAQKHQAAALLFVNDRDLARGGDGLLAFGMTATLRSPAKLPALHVRRAIVDEMLQSSLGVGLLDVERDIDRTLRPQSAALAGWRVSLDVHVRRQAISLKNVVGVLEGSGPLAQETVIVGAHYDHLGYGEPGSLARLRKAAIHHGADDNGSGTTALLELARHFGQQMPHTGRRLLFIAFSGEEAGLLGSEYYCKKPLVPLAGTVAMVNMDMIGRLRKDRQGWKALLAVLTPPPQCGLPLASLAALTLTQRNHWLPLKDRLVVNGTGTAQGFDRLLDRVNQKYHFQLYKSPGGFGPSDHASFYAKKIPVFFFFTGDHPDYHRPSDTADKINVAGLRQVTDLVADLVEQLRELPQRPQYVKVAEPKRPLTYNIPRLGIRPSYGDTEEGVLVAGVSEGGPADQAGLKEGDRIIAIAGKPVKDLDEYMVLMASHKRGQPLEIGILRNGQKVRIKVTPE